MTTKTEAVGTFLLGASSPLAKLYDSLKEVQVNVAKGDGVVLNKEFSGRKWRGFHNPETEETWKSFRIPFNSGTEAEYIDTEIGFDLYDHAEAIGMTGWSYDGYSHWVGYDIDSILNHKAGISEEDIKDIERRASEVSWINLYTSTSAKGFHLYLFFEEPVKTANHFEHSALARSLLSVLTVNMGINFTAKVDCVGSILWVWSRKQVARGLQLISEGTKFPNDLIPKNWKEHIPVVTNRRTRKKPESGAFEKLFASIKNVLIDDEHHKILKWFQDKAKRDSWWDIDYSRLVCHTLDLKQCHTDLNLRGNFETDTTGSSSHNCFCYPMDDGGFSVRRFGIKVNEHDMWETDPTGWTKCYYNVKPSFAQSMRFYGGLEDSKGWFNFDNPLLAERVINVLELKLNIKGLPNNKISFQKPNNGRVIVKIVREKKDPPSITGFITNKVSYERVLYVLNETEVRDSSVTTDSIVRHVVSNDSDAGWYLSINKIWISHVKHDVISVLAATMPVSNRSERELFIAESLLDPWFLVNKPFQPEYIGDREWNKDSAQFSVAPVEGKFLSWVSLLEHVSININDCVSNNKWCQDNLIESGTDYLMLWVASMLRRPSESLPYLFLYSRAFKTGKTTFWEALKLFFKRGKGFARIDSAITNSSGWNDEIAGCVLGVIEEIDLSKDALAYNRIKDWTTGTTIPINTRFQSTYDIENTLHIIHTANTASFCPIPSGDNRILPIEVFPLESEIPKTTFMASLKAELPYFLYYLISMDLPEPHSRLAIPCLETEIKEDIQEIQRDPMERFVLEQTKYVRGNILKFSEVEGLARMWLTTNYPAKTWSKADMLKSMPQLFERPFGKYGSDNVRVWGNTSIDPEDKPVVDKLCKLVNGRVKLCSMR